LMYALCLFFIFFFFFFFFQAEDGIRDATVTGVQTCALPISCFDFPQSRCMSAVCSDSFGDVLSNISQYRAEFFANALTGIHQTRSEERRVGKECRSRW